VKASRLISGPISAVETMGLEPTTPCLQRRPIRTTANGYGQIEQVKADFGTTANDHERLRMRPECAPPTGQVLRASTTSVSPGQS
jgi:hypothetical protein